MKNHFGAIVAAIICSVVIIWTAPATRRELARAARGSTENGGMPTLAAEAIEKLNAEWKRDHQRLAEYEREQSRRRAIVIEKRKLHQQGAIAKADVTEAERAFVATLMQIQEARRALAETDLALAEATMGSELAQLPPLAQNEFSETKRLARFNGASPWSLKETPRVESFYSQTFGRQLPISAYGQSKTHDRMGLDHRDAIDVALHPDSREGQALIQHLRGSKIPFIAFKHSVPGASTGPHIHIGKPSIRIAAR